MNPEIPKQPLADQKWFVDFLASKGFEKSSPTTFSRGQASIHLEGTQFHADPGTGTKGWSTEFPEVEDKGWSTEADFSNRASIKAILEQILKMRPFLTAADLAQEQLEKQRLERALTGIANTIKNGPDTGGGIQLRRFLWSLYNDEHLVNLYRMACVLDSTRGAWVAEVCAGAFDGVLKEEDLKRALLVAGEMQRWDEVAPSSEQKHQLQEALEKVEAVLKTLPPSRGHVELDRVRKSLFDAKDGIRRATESAKELD